MGGEVMKHVILVTIILLLAFYGCGTKNPEPFKPPEYKEKAVDANKDGVINEDDVVILDDQADTLYKGKIEPILLKIGIKDKLQLYTDDAKFRARSRLTVIEWESLKQNLDDWNRLQSQVDATMTAYTNAILDAGKEPIRSGKVRSCADWGGIELYDGTVIKYAGITLYVNGTNDKYSRLAATFSAKLLVGRIIKYQYTGKKEGNVNESLVWINDLCINEELVKRGYALAIKDKSDMSDKLIELEQQARDEGLGLWKFIKQNPSGGALY
jgi:hypothetical protein